jgi:hypothetical protein
MRSEPQTGSQKNKPGVSPLPGEGRSAGLRREAKYPADEAAGRPAFAPRGSPDVVLVNDARKELIGKQRGAFKVHRISPKNKACRHIQDRAPR